MLRESQTQTGRVHTRWVDENVDALAAPPSAELASLAEEAASHAGDVSNQGNVATIAPDPWRDLRGFGR